MSESGVVIGVIGGTGALGGAIARRLAKGGYSVIIGSRNQQNAQTAAATLTADLGQRVRGDTNIAAAQAASMILVTTPYASQDATLTEIRGAVQGKLVIDATVPLMPPKVMQVKLPPCGSAAVNAQKLLGPEVRVVSAFHNVAAAKLATNEPIDCDVLVFGDDKSARQRAIQIIEACGLRGLHGGALVNSAAAEALTSVLIFINKNYAVEGAGLRITGNLRASSALPDRRGIQ